MIKIELDGCVGRGGIFNFSGQKRQMEVCVSCIFSQLPEKMSFCFDNQPQVHKIKKKKIHRINSRTIKGENEF